jgi:hypothetical protein
VLAAGIGLSILLGIAAFIVTQVIEWARAFWRSLRFVERRNRRLNAEYMEWMRNHAG